MPEESNSSPEQTPQSQNLRPPIIVASIAAAVILIALVATITMRGSSMGFLGMMGFNNKPQSHPTYRLNLMTGKSYAVSASTPLRFDIQDQNGKTLKDFDTVHEKKLHLIVVRADRTNFQHVHPVLDPKTGTFTIEKFNFPTDGPYRIFADFTASSAQMDEMGMKLAATPFQDVKVGDISKYTPLPLIADKLSSSANGLDTSIFFPPGDDSPAGGLLKDFYAGRENSINISVNKNGLPFTTLQTYLGALGHMVVLGPNLEFIHGHPQTTDINNQYGILSFSINPPTPGRYRLFLQTQASEQINTTDYAITVQASIGGNSSGGGSMMNMDHGGK